VTGSHLVTRRPVQPGAFNFYRGNYNFADLRRKSKKIGVFLVYGAKSIGEYYAEISSNLLKKTRTIFDRI
jgi:hypothetical protein